jgi:hypothetical protein
MLSHLSELTIGFQAMSSASSARGSSASSDGSSRYPGSMASAAEIDPSVPPSGTGCADCLAGAEPGWWLHLRRCAECGHVGCCDSSPAQHASAHFRHTGHPVIQSFEPEEDWFYDFRSEQFVEGPRLAAPDSHPREQPVPGPAGMVPPDWQSKLH